MGRKVDDEMILLREEEQRLTYQYKQAKNEITKIKNSSSWRYSKPLRFFMNLKEKFFPKHVNLSYVKQIEKENVKLQELIFKQEEMLEKLFGMSEQMQSLERQQFLRKLKNEGKLLAYLQTYVEESQQNRAYHREALIYIARLYMNEEKEERDYVYKFVRQGLGINEMPEFMLRPGLEEDNHPLQEVASFRTSLSMRLRQYQWNNQLPEWYLDDKRLAYKFVHQQGIETPSVDEQIYSIDTLPLQAGIVIKPADGAGARGVYIIHEESDIINVKHSTNIDSYATLKKAMEMDIASNAVSKDEWLVEEIVYEDKNNKRTGRDLKFYSFYGKVGLILEIVRYPEVRHCWWTAAGERIGTGKYNESLFYGLGVSEEEMKMVNRLSEEIPAPFVRIDFLRSENGLVFGEFTPKPGNYDEFNEVTDRLLGDYFIEAESKLTRDLLNKKAFIAFEQLQKEMAEVRLIGQ